MNIEDEMYLINKFSTHKKVVFIKVYDRCLKISKSNLNIYDKNRKIIRYYKMYMHYCSKQNKIFQEKCGIYNIF